MEELYAYYIEADSLHMKYAKGEPLVKTSEFHDYNEFVFFIEGESVLISNNIQQSLTHGSVVLIPKEHFHRFNVKKPETYTRCILGFRETSEIYSLVCEVMHEIKVIVAPDKSMTALFENLIEIIKSNLSQEEKILFIRSSIAQLLIYIKKNPSGMISKSVGFSPMVKQALDIIEEKYAKKLSLEMIAKQLYTTPSTLSHKFSRELNISVYQYITKKRLSVAHELIQNGESMTSAALRSGFNDYSCFYRLYKKYYKNKLR